jgi:hypothetical protein
VGGHRGARARGVPQRALPRPRGRDGRADGLRGAHTIARLTKRDVEHLLDRYDADPVAALARALGIVHDDADADSRGTDAFDDLVLRSGFDADTTSSLLARDIRAMDDLARSLNERRGLA